MKLHTLTLTLVLCAMLVPLSAVAQVESADQIQSSDDPYAFARNGVFGCPIDGQSSSVGARAATSGAYVPVNDAAVTINTYTLVYKECVLRNLLIRQREAATADLGRGGVLTYMTGRDGNPQFSQNLPAERAANRDRVIQQLLQNGTLDTLRPEFKGTASRAVVNGYVTQRNAANSAFACSYSGVQSALNGRPEGSIWDAISALRNPACNPYGATVLVDEHLRYQAETEVQDQMTRLGWGRGTYGKEIIDENGNLITVTPGSIIEGNIMQLLQSGYRQLENADDIDQMVGSLFAGITSHIIGDSRGLAGLTQSTGGKLSYLDQVSREAAAAVRNAAVNTALQVLSAAKAVESAIKQILDTTAGVLTNTIGTLRARENACWTLIIEKVCTAAPGADNKCQSKPVCTTATATEESTCTTSQTLSVATSTAFSQAVIDAQVASLAETTIADLQKTTDAITQLDLLITNVTNTVSIEGQRAALQQLDILVANGRLHSRYDIDAAQTRYQNTASAMATLITDTTAAWADASDPEVGWCNVNNDKVIEKWTNAWKQ